ncbi:MAG: PVC-type heme-binding CxxCH protein [Gemmataceae bacterium]
MSRRLLSLLLAAAFISPAFAQDRNVASTPPLTPDEQKAKFTLPPGFEMQLVAVEPEINKPINIAFDAAGRLWVTGSIEYPYAADPKKARDKCWILEDFAPNGRARKITTYAENLNIPIGVLPTPTGALIYSIPNIWSYDTKDGQGTNKTALYSAYGFNDTHGMTGEFMWGFDGWIYCCHGFSNTSKVKSQGDTAIAMQSGNTYRIKPDGSRIEQFTWGQVNPFGLAFDPLGNLYSADCHSRPLYQLLKGAYYPSFGKPHDGLGFAPEMVTHDHGSTAIAGCCWYADDHYPEEFRDNLYVGNVMTNRVNRDRIDWKGSSPKGIEMPDLVKCSDPWYRPVDIKLGPDGCLYIADFYNRIIGHYEVPLNHPGRDREKGRIWRLVYTGKDGKGGPKPFRELTKATTAELVEELGNTNLTVRIHAANLLAAQKKPETAELVERALKQDNAFRTAHGLWVLERISALKDDVLRDALARPERVIKVHALKILGERAKISSEQERAIVNALGGADPFVQRAAGEAAGSHSSSALLDSLVALRKKTSGEDTHLTHVLRMSIRNQTRTKNGLDHAIAMKDASDRAVVADVALGNPNAAAAQFLVSYLDSSNEPFGSVQRKLHHVIRYGGDAAGEWAVAWGMKRFPKDLDVQGQVLKTLQQATQERGGKVSDAAKSRGAEIANQLLAGNSGQIALGVELAGMMKLATTQDALSKIVQNPKVGEPVRKNAIQALAAFDLKRNGSLLADLLLQDSAPIALREQAAQTLASSDAPEPQAALIKAFEKAPARLQTNIALALVSSPKGAERLLGAIESGKASPRLLQDRGVDGRIRQTKLAKLDERLAKLTKSLPPADQNLQAVIAKKRDAISSAKFDLDAGHKAFVKHCAACHQIANQGAKIGPQLDGVGIRGMDRILEDVLDPNRNVDQAFRSTTYVLEDGKLVTGLQLREEGEIFVVADAQGKEVRVPKANVSQRLTSQLSPMPANIVEQVPEEEFRNLVGYLLSQRPKQ